jgi:NADPH:quinone reductase-like Zn-dependent oxidoreductase
VYAIRLDAPGDPDILVPREWPDPPLGPGQVRIRIRAAGVNHRDVWVRSGRFGGFARPIVVGSDAAGEVLEVAPDITTWQVGDRVVVNPNRSCGHCIDCLAGRDNACPAFHIWDGAYASTQVVDASQLAAMPSGLTFEEAAAIGVPYVTAEEALVRAGALPGQTLVVFGATGGLGLAVVQLGRLRGLRVIAVTRRASLQERLLQEGAHDVLVADGRRDLAQEVVRRTQGRGADIVFDSVGEPTFGVALGMAARGGVVVTAGATAGGRVTLELGHLFRRRLTVVGAYMGSRSVLGRLLPLFGRGALKPVIDEVLPLEQAPRAHRRMEAGDLFGKIILVPPWITDTTRSST